MTYAVLQAAAGFGALGGLTETVGGLVRFTDENNFRAQLASKIKNGRVVSTTPVTPTRTDVSVELDTAAGIAEPEAPAGAVVLAPIEGASAFTSPLTIVITTSPAEVSELARPGSTHAVFAGSVGGAVTGEPSMLAAIKGKLSTTALIGIVAGVAALGIVVYVARKKR